MEFAKLAAQRAAFTAILVPDTAYIQVFRQRLAHFRLAPQPITRYYIRSRRRVHLMSFSAVTESKTLDPPPSFRWGNYLLR